MISYYSSPLGGLHIEMENGAVTSIAWNEAQLPEVQDPHLVLLFTELDQYFDGSLTHFSTPVKPMGSEFDLKVWKLLQNIPYGTTVSYMDIARQVGDVHTIRAVGGANGRNRIPILIPCHRVIGTDGSLTGFSGGLDKKVWLLEHEGAIAKQLTAF